MEISFVINSKLIVQIILIIYVIASGATSLVSFIIKLTDKQRQSVFDPVAAMLAIFGTGALISVLVGVILGQIKF